MQLRLFRSYVQGCDYDSIPTGVPIPKQDGLLSTREPPPCQRSSSREQESSIKEGSKDDVKVGQRSQ